MLAPVVVVVNVIKPFTHASSLFEGTTTGAVVSGFLLPP